MIIRRLPKSALALLYAMYFCAGFAVVFSFLSHYVDEKTTFSVEENPPPFFEVLAFDVRNVRIVKLSQLEDFKLRNPEYSFLASEYNEKVYVERLNRENEGVKFAIEVEQIEPGKQRISFSSDDIRSIIVNRYEATDKEVFPKTFTHQNMRDTFFKCLPSAIGGLITCLIFFVIHRKYLAK